MAMALMRIRLRGTILYRPSPRAVLNQLWMVLWVSVRWPRDRDIVESRDGWMYVIAVTSMER